MTGDLDIAPVPSQPEPASTAPAPDPALTTHRTKIEALMWTIAGAVSAYGGAVVAWFMTLDSIENSTDDYAGLLVILTVPLGFIVGLTLVMLYAWSEERMSRSHEDLFTRTQLAFAGAILPIAIPIGVIYTLNWIAA